MKTDVLIIGAGLTGLTLGYQLKQKGIPFKIIEARNRAGGRINTIYSGQETPIEMGATWLSTEHKYLLSLLNELNIPVFEQFMSGIALFESLSTAPPQHFQIPANQAPSYRMSGGTSRLIDALIDYIGKDHIILNQVVKKIEHQENNEFQIYTNNAEYISGKVISTLPPKLLVNTIKFTLELPEKLISLANNTHTWMGESIKFGITFQHPFWRTQNYSGTVFSNVGPITELYDHCSVEDNKYALKGFLQSPLCHESEENRKSKVLSQLQKLFGDQVLHYVTYEELLWKNEKYTSCDTDQFLLPHQNNGNEHYQDGFFNNNFYVGGSETSRTYGGYMEGAILSANFIFKKIT
ncbi:FAD-dependent oxidoreductase [Aquimarina sp. D1M17]|uniref:flavin monoamine oxidase family protein n=1 Tax=Aquimarina acroporae TaxID=2937283 RepID=UPI0020BDDAED|nr:NAD(P)/FAD-dependent oxidoreductase [Aquimarina acroporae]MCK8521611.1 FAD-dependent oxidoreductase [Aquimarina acroporae]